MTNDAKSYVKDRKTFSIKFLVCLITVIETKPNQYREKLIYSFPRDIDFPAIAKFPSLQSSSLKSCLQAHVVFFWGEMCSFLQQKKAKV